MSVLDMFASALGAFIMCAVILFPYYQDIKYFEKSIEKTKEAIRKTEADLAAAKQRVKVNEDTKLQLQQQLRASQTSSAATQQCRADAVACRASLTKTFLVISIEWAERCDVDLYVKDPSGTEYYFSNKKVSGSEAELSYDMTDGPGLEIWQVPVATPGRYEVFYKPLRRLSEAVTVKGLYIDRSGRHELPVKNLRCGADKVRVATIQVNATGAVTHQAN